MFDLLIMTAQHMRSWNTSQCINEFVHVQAPLEFSNPIEGPDSQPNGRTVFVPTIGDFVLFPSYLGHTVPMRLLRDKQQPRISIAFNIWLAGPGLDRYPRAHLCCSYQLLLLCATCELSPVPIDG